jgi:hypothetical protein
MTLLIACILIYHYDMQWWWYAIAFAVEFGELSAKVDARRYIRERMDLLLARLGELRRDLID